MAYQLQEINSRVRKNPAEFINACEESFFARVNDAADRILAKLEQSPIVLLSGPSGSGKTTTAFKLQEELERRGYRCHTVSLDNYFKTFNPKTVPRTENGEIDLESPRNMDTELLDDHFTALAKGQEIVVPKFEFARQMRNDSMGRPLRLRKNEIAIFEGIHALNDEIFGRHPEATGLYISARSNVLDGDDLRFKGTWMRLTRRAVRDYNFRGTQVGDTLYMWDTVRRGEKLYISPFKHRADSIIDSSLPYEPAVMKHFAKPLLEAIPTENQRKTELLDLVRAFDSFEPVDPALVPEQSILREFIGGGCYKYS